MDLSVPRGKSRAGCTTVSEERRVPGENETLHHSLARAAEREDQPGVLGVVIDEALEHAGKLRRGDHEAPLDPEKVVTNFGRSRAARHGERPGGQHERCGQRRWPSTDGRDA